MSVLDRMVERTYGALPSVAPLLRPGARASGQSIPVSTEDGFRIEHARRTASFPEVRTEGTSTLPPHPGDRNPDVDGNRPRSAAPEKVSAAPDGTVRREASRTDHASNHDDRRVRPGDRITVPSPAGEGSGLPGSFPTDSPPLSALPAAGGSEVEPERSVATPFTEALFEVAPVRHGADARTTTGWEDSRPVRSENVFAERRPAPSEPEPPPEIHITIGRIELRGPRSEPKPSPPFRPRVSLDELLGRASGSNR